LVLGFSIRVANSSLARNGLDMTVVAIGTCMIIAVATQSEWVSPGFTRPLLSLGQRSYEVYLTHMFIVFGFFQLFVLGGKRMSAVPLLFLAVICAAGFLGELVARFYSEPVNQMIRRRWGRVSSRPGSS
jgi:peptidoglycan/LPS O-acetylase OafA/YrhL